MSARLCACGHHAGYHTAGGRCTHHTCFGATAPCLTSADPCTWCNLPRADCERANREQRKCCPDCTHPAGQPRAPGVIEPLGELEAAAFDLVEHVIRRDLPTSATRVELVRTAGEHAWSTFAQLSFGEPAIRWTAGQTLAQAFEHARAMWRRGR